MGILIAVPTILFWIVVDTIIDIMRDIRIPCTRYDGQIANNTLERERSGLC
jgi:hypothetical protein